MLPFIVYCDISICTEGSFCTHFLDKTFVCEFFLIWFLHMIGYVTVFCSKFLLLHVNTLWSHLSCSLCWMDWSCIQKLSVFGSGSCHKSLHNICQPSTLHTPPGRPGLPSRYPPHSGGDVCVSVPEITSSSHLPPEGAPLLQVYVNNQVFVLTTSFISAQTCFSIRADLCCSLCFSGDVC